jgi:hypothetical protein
MTHLKPYKELTQEEKKFFLEKFKEGCRLNKKLQWIFLFEDTFGRIFSLLFVGSIWWLSFSLIYYLYIMYLYY